MLTTVDSVFNSVDSVESGLSIGQTGSEPAVFDSVVLTDFADSDFEFVDSNLQQQCHQSLADCGQA